MPSNTSTAVWCVKRANAVESAFQAHFNYWRIAGDEDFCRKSVTSVRDFLEVGILLEKPTAVERVCIFLPHEIETEALQDCSSYFYRAELAQGIFNEVLTVTAAAAPSSRFVELNDKNGVFCRVHRFMMNGRELDTAEVTKERVPAGTVITIKPLALVSVTGGSDSEVRAYFRLRVTLENANQEFFVRKVPTPDRLFQSGYEEIEYIDFRLNDARTLPEPIEALMRIDQAGLDVKLQLVAFLTAVPVQSEIAISHAKSHKFRLLEHQLWSSYVPSELPLGMMVYHWKHEQKSGISDFSAFVKLQTRRSGRLTVTKYLIIAFLFGVLGNLAASALETVALKWLRQSAAPQDVSTVDTIPPRFPTGAKS